MREAILQVKDAASQFTGSRMIGRYLLRVMDTQPTIFTSCALGVFGFSLPYFVPDIRAAMGGDVGIFKDEYVLPKPKPQ